MDQERYVYLLGMQMDRQQLPYRKVCNAILIHNSRVLCQKLKTYIKLPGGGVDSGESAKQALLRELQEETGVSVKQLSLVQELKIDWNEQWHNNEPKKMQRYNEFRGEHVFMFIGVIKSFDIPTSKEGDEWAKTPAEIKKKYLCPLKQIIPIIESGIQHTSRNVNFDTLYVLQLAILKMLQLIKV